MKIFSTLLLIALLGLASLGSMSFVTATSQTNSKAASTTEIQPNLTGSGYLSGYDKDFWWIYNVTKGDSVIINIIASTWPYTWLSHLTYSNLTEVFPEKRGYDTHNYEFIANETDDYLLRLRTGSHGFSYTIQSSHLALEQTMYTKSGYLSAYEIDYYLIPNVTKGDLVLLSILAHTWPYTWLSHLTYSNLTEVFPEKRGYDTHNYEFIANETDDYLLRLRTGSHGFSYTVECALARAPHPVLWHDVAITDVAPDKTVVVQGELVRIYVDLSNIGNFTETIPAATAYYDSTPIDSVRVENLTPGESRTLQFNWTTTSTPTGNYTIKAASGLIPLEIDTTNNEYTDGEVTVVPPPPEINFSIEPNPAVVGQTVSLLGNLTAIDGTPIPSVQVTIKLDGTPIASLTTNATGWFKASGNVGSAGTFNITAEYLQSSDSEILAVNRSRTEIYAKFLPNPVSSGNSCELGGILVDQFSNPLRSMTVTIEYSTDYGLTWNPAGTLITDSYGIFSKTFTAPAPGTYLVRIIHVGSSNYESSATDIPLLVR